MVSCGKWEMSQQSQFLLLPNSGAGYKKSTESQTVYNSKLKEDREEAVGYFILQIHRRTQGTEENTGIHEFEYKQLPFGEAYF